MSRAPATATAAAPVTAAPRDGASIRIVALRPSGAFPAFIAAVAILAGGCAEMFQPVLPPPTATPTEEISFVELPPLVRTATPTPTSTPTPAPPLVFRFFSASFVPAVSTTRYEIRVEDPLGGQFRYFWSLRFDRGVCGDLEVRWETRVPRNGYVHDGCDVDVVERGAKVEVQVVRPTDFLPEGALRPGARYLLYVRSARAGDSVETRAWPLDEVISQQTVP